MYQTYDLVTKAHLRLGHGAESIESCRYQCHLCPTRAMSYQLLGLAYEADGQREQAAIADLQAVVLGGDDPALVPHLAKRYELLQPQTPMIFVQNGKPTLNIQNPLARHDLNEACRQLAQIFIDGQKPRPGGGNQAAIHREFRLPGALFSDLH